MYKNHTFSFITAAYGFVFFAGQLTNAAYIPIAPGEYKTGSLGAGQMHTYRFTASAGDSATIQMGWISGYDFAPWVELQAPDGTVLDAKSGDRSAYMQSVKLPQSGAYFIIAKDRSGFYGGDYGLSLVKIPGTVTVNDPNGGPMEPGEYKRGTIEPGDIDAYTFTASAGDSATIQMARISGYDFAPCVELHAPDGTVLDVKSGGSSAYMPSVKLPQSGTYFIIAKDKSGMALPSATPLWI